MSLRTIGVNLIVPLAACNLVLAKPLNLLYWVMHKVSHKCIVISIKMARDLHVFLSEH